MEPLAVAAALTIPAAIGYSWWRKAPLSLTVGVSILATFLLVTIAGRIDPSLETWGNVLLDLGVRNFDGRPSTPLAYLTAMFLHVEMIHLVFNLLFLVTFGPILEERIGRLRWGVLYFVGGGFGSLVFVLVHFADPSPYILLGASGALSSVFGAFGRLYPYERITMWIPIPMPRMAAVYYVILFIIAQLGLSLLVGAGVVRIAWEAHLAGVAFGFAAAPLVMRIPGRRRAERVRDFTALQPLIAGRELQESYDHLAAETLPEAQAAWLEKFARQAPCPRCGKPLRYGRGAMRSECGWRLKLG